jgi:putative selenium metabolism hydrolase
MSPSPSPYLSELIDFHRQLVRLPSLPGQEREVADTVLQKMKSLDFDEVFRDQYGNAVGRKQGTGSGSRILFDAHMDVVSVTTPEAWTSDPFGAEIRDGRIYGRGASDTKGSLAAMVVGLGRLSRSEFCGEIIVVGSVGEEILEGAGLAPVLDTLKPDGVIIGEPTDCRLGIGQRGRARLLFKAIGRAAHSSSPDQSQNAMYRAADLIQRIRLLPLPQDPDLGNGLMAPIQIISQPFPSTSTQPFLCEIVYDRRLIRGETEHSVLAEYNQGLANLTDWSVELVSEGYKTYSGLDLHMPDFHPAWMMPADSPIVQKSVEALKASSIDPQPFTAPYCTNGSASAGERNIPSLIFGPSSINQAHIVDESIEISELDRGMLGYVAIAKSLGK